MFCCIISTNFVMTIFSLYFTFENWKDGINLLFFLSDLDLLKISALCGSLSYLNIKGCTMVTDMGISKLISKCLHIKSLILSYTSFGKSSVGVLCSDLLLTSNLTEASDHKYSCTMAFRLQQLHVDGCKGTEFHSLFHKIGLLGFVA